MDQRSATIPVFVGIDVAKDRLEAHLLPSGEAFAVPRDHAGLERLVARLDQVAPAMVVLEATGGFEITVAAALSGAKLPLAIVNPRQVRFARALGRRPVVGPRTRSTPSIERLCVDARSSSSALALVRCRSPR